MSLRMFGVYDVKSDSYHTPFFMPTNGMAIRVFKDMANDVNSFIGMHPEDYKLVLLAEFDNQNGEIVPLGAVSLGFAMDFVEKSNLKLREVS